MTTINYKELKSLYISDPSSAINESQRIICSVTNFKSFTDFYNYHLEHSHISTCQNEWSKYQMSLHCIECALDNQSCFCLQCFLNSNHEGHNYLVRPNSLGNCDCGDLSLWKRSGFCSKHHGLEDDSHPEDYLDEKLRTTLTDIIFKAAFSAINHLQSDKGPKISIIIQFLTSFLKFGDGFRRLLAISLTEKIKFEKLFYSIFDATSEFNQHLQRFCGLLVNDQLFKNNFSSVNFKLMIEKIIPLTINNLTSKTPNAPLGVWKSFWFHSFLPLQFKYNIEKRNWDWVKFGVDVANYSKELILLVGNPNYRGTNPDCLFNAAEIDDASKIQPNEQTQSFFDQLSSKILPLGTSKGVQESINDTIISTSFKEKTEESHYSILYFFNYIFYRLLGCFKSKENLKFDKFFEEFDKAIDISPIFAIGANVVESDNQIENDKFVSKFIKPSDTKLNLNKNNYKSFHNGASFYINHPMYYTLLYLLRNDNLSRVKIAQILSTPKYQSLRVQLGIITLKNLLSYVCLHENLVRKSNFGAISLLKPYIDNPQLANFGIPLLFPAFQLLIGLQGQINDDEFSLKEFFAFEMAREIGLFDNYDGIDYKNEDQNENQKQMIFSFLYVSILLVIERTLFNFDGYEFIKEQIVFGLKRGLSNLNDLNDMFDKKVVTAGRFMAEMNKVISEVATARQKKSKEAANEQDVSFDLKEGIEFRCLSAINSFNEEKVIMNDQISKNPTVLLKIQNFEPEETYFFQKDEKNQLETTGLSVKLNEFLLTPTVLAVIYHTLRFDSEKVELNDHLALNILVLISKFVQDNDDDFAIDEKIIINYKSVADLISQLRKTVFDFKIENDKATIKNRLTKKAFNSLLKVKICPENKPSKSFIDILTEKGEIGKSVLGQMSIEIDGTSGQSEKNDIKKMKKLRAQQMKDTIMNHYKNLTANFNLKDDQNDDQLTPSNSIENQDVCLICSQSKKDEVLSYPIYIYRTKFPFIIDKPPFIELPVKEAVKETEVFEDELVISDLENNNEENEEDEHESILSPDEVLSIILSRNPGLRLSDDLTDEQIMHRRMMIQMIKQQINEKYEISLARLNEKKRRRKERKKLKEQFLMKKELNRKMVEENPELIVSKQLTPGNVFVLQFGICQHLVHPNCINKSDYECPVDRSTKNGFLPNITDLHRDQIYSNDYKDGDEITTKSISQKVVNSISTFLLNLSCFNFTSTNRVIDVFLELVKSISGLISTYEVRLRSLPDCLDSQKTIILPRNLFLSAWYGYRIQGKPVMKTGFEDNLIVENVESRLTVFQRFIKKLIECDEIESSIQKKDQLLNDIVSSLIKELKNEKEICLFLRRVCLADHFLLQKGKNDQISSEFIDWDEILSLQNLSQKFNVTFKTIDVENGQEFEFRPFMPFSLPREFLRFAQRPFNLPIDQTHEICMFDLIDYNFLIKNYNDFDDCDMNKFEENYINQIYKSSDESANSFFVSNFSHKKFPSIVLSIGKSASSVYAINQKQIALLKPFYTDRFGCTDIGFRRNQPLFLNEVRLDRIIDEVLSGDFTSSLKFLAE